MIISNRLAVYHGAYRERQISIHTHIHTNSLESPVNPNISTISPLYISKVSQPCLFKFYLKCQIYFRRWQKISQIVNWFLIKACLRRRIVNCVCSVSFEYNHVLDYLLKHCESGRHATCVHIIIYVRGRLFQKRADDEWTRSFQCW